MNKQEIEKAIDVLNGNKEGFESLLKDQPDHPMRGHIEHQIDCLKLGISALEQQLTNGWIPVSERLPNQEESIKYRAVFLIQDKYIDLPYMAIWNRIKNIWVDEDGDRINSVIAWQPLPPEYKEVSE